MKTYHSTLMALIFIMCLSACSQSNNKHQELLNWLDANEHTFSLDKGMSEDSAIISLLSNFSDLNNKFNPTQPTTITGKILLVDANKYYRAYLKARSDASLLAGCPDTISNDSTEAILVRFDYLFSAASAAFGPNFFSDLPSKSFIIFPANYGSVGVGTSRANRNQTTAILQFAKQDISTADTTDWKVLTDQLYDFGELKPPKFTITNSGSPTPQ